MGGDSLDTVCSMFACAHARVRITLRRQSDTMKVHSATCANRRKRLLVIYDDESVKENSNFFHEIVRGDGKTGEFECWSDVRSNGEPASEASRQRFNVRAEKRDGRSVSFIGANADGTAGNGLTVTGQLVRHVFSSECPCALTVLSLSLSLTHTHRY